MMSHTGSKIKTGKIARIISLILMICIQRSYMKPITLRTFVILRGGTNYPVSDNYIKIFYTAVYLELEFDPSEPIFTLQFGTIKKLKMHVMRLKGVSKKLLPVTPGHWVDSIPLETKKAILQKLKSLTKFKRNKVITTVTYPSKDISTLPLFLLNCQEGPSVSPEGTAYLEADHKIEQKLADEILKEKSFLLSFIPNNILVYKTKSQKNYYRVSPPSDTTFNHSSTYSSLYFYIVYQGDSLADLTPTRISFASYTDDAVLFRHSESSESKDQYLTNLSASIEESLKPAIVDLHKPLTFKVPTVSKYIPISTTGAFMSHYGNVEMSKIEGLNYKGDPLDKLLNGFVKEGSVKEGGQNFGFDKENKKVLRIFGGITGMEKYVKGYEFDLNKKYGNEEARPEVVDKESGNGWKWALGIGIIVLVLGGVGVLVWIKFFKKKLSYVKG